MITGIDVGILIAMLFSAIVSAFRGFFREAISLGTWIGAVLLTLMFTSRFATLLPKDTIESPTARLGISAVVLFVGCMLVGSLINWLFQKIMASSTLGTSDRVIGFMFGMARGAIIVAIVVLLANLVPTLKLEAWWRDSLLLPHFQQAAHFIYAQLPREIAQHFDFSQPSI